MVTYHTRYASTDGKQVSLSFGLGNEVAVNAIVGKPTLKAWKGCIDFSNDMFTSEVLRLSFAMEYKMADTGLPPTVMFDSTSFVRPKPNINIGAYVVSIDREDNSASTATSITGDNTVTDCQIDGCLKRTVSEPTKE